jgi:hypothetical protein
MDGVNTFIQLEKNITVFLFKTKFKDMEDTTLLAGQNTKEIGVVE